MPAPQRPEMSVARLREVARYEPDTGHLIRLIKTGKRSIVGERMGGLHVVRKPGREDRYYRYITIDYLRAMEHRAVWAWMTGDWPPDGYLVDHEDNDGTNNKWKNLRLVTPAQNTVRRGRLSTHKSSPYKGVYSQLGMLPWFAQMTVDSRAIRIGSFGTAEEAKAAFDAEMRKQFGRYADGE
jgi:hypothetical protein